ncbi:MAG: acetoacetyl-CoA reductase [Pseudomonadota bacterium]
MSRVTIVTGGTRGIGLAVTRRLKALGHKIATFYAGDEGHAERCRNELGVLTLRCDVGDFEQCRRAVAETEQALGPVDILINNAGITRDATLHHMTVEQWDQVIRTDLSGVFYMCRNIIEGMRARGFGRIVNISSINGQKGQFGQTNYSAAKAGLIGFTKALALESARSGITVNAVAPGYIETDMVAAVPPKVMASIKEAIPVGHLGTPDDVARCVAFLVADEAAYITGATLTANGGQYMT